MKLNTVKSIAAWNVAVEQILYDERHNVPQSFDAYGDLVEHDIRIHGVVRGQRVA